MNTPQELNYEYVVIGAGSGGLVAAIGLAKLGYKTLLIEKDKIGGDCTHYGCVPSKALLHAADKLHIEVRVLNKLPIIQNIQQSQKNCIVSKFFMK